MILFYRIFTTLLYPILFLFTYSRLICKKEDPFRYKEKLLVSRFNVVKKNSLKLIWFHAASLGEFKSIIPIINELNKNTQNLKFLITTTTLSSGNLAKIELKNFKNAEHRYLPYDVPFLMNKFLDLWRPDKIFLVDSEIWPNLIIKAKKLNIPIALINARLTSKSFKRWMLFPDIAKKIFGMFDLYICSSNETKKLLETLELKKIYFKGNIKFINQTDKREIRNINENILPKKRFWFAASTHKEEEIFCLKTHLKIKEIYKDIVTIIAPRHVNRAKKIVSLSQKYNLNVQLLEKDNKISDGKEIIVINHFGVLQNYYEFAKSVFIGKSVIKKLKNDGGQNPLEAAKLKCKIYHGPYVYNFEEVYKILEANNKSKMVENYDELSNNLIKDLENPVKQKNQNSFSINNLAEKTLADTMKLVKNFIHNDVI